MAQVSEAVQAGRNLQSKHCQNGVSSSYIPRLITNNSATSPSSTLRTFPQLPTVCKHRKRAVASCIGGATGRAAHCCDRQPEPDTIGEELARKNGSLCFPHNQPAFVDRPGLCIYIVEVAEFRPAAALAIAKSSYNRRFTVSKKASLRRLIFPNRPGKQLAAVSLV